MLCGHTLARAHARSGDAIAISAYLGDSKSFDKAVSAFAESYADQTSRILFTGATADGALSAHEDAGGAEASAQHRRSTTARPHGSAPPSERPESKSAQAKGR